MSKPRRRKISILLAIGASFVVFVITGTVASGARPEAVKRMRAVATIDATGRASVTERIDYFFPRSRHGIYRTLDDLPFADAMAVQVSSDTYADTQLIPQGNGTKIRIGNPSKTIKGDHTYTITYPLDTLSLNDKGDFGWNGVGLAWVVPIQKTELDMVAPWKWEGISCATGTGGAFGDCRVTQPEPGHLMVSYDKTLPSGSGLTIYAKRGAALVAAPKPRELMPFTESTPWWKWPLALAVVTALCFMLSALVMGKVLRRRGRDWVVGGPIGAGDAAGVAFGSPNQMGGVRRVDDEELAALATTEFAPPSDLTAWQGGVVAAETVVPAHKTAWLLAAAEAGYLDLDDSDPKKVVLRAREHAPDATTLLLGVAFAGRSKITLGTYDPSFTSMWTSLPSSMKEWMRASGLQDNDADKTTTIARGVGGLVTVLSIAFIVAAGFAFSRVFFVAYPLAVFGGLLGGAALMTAIRGWELRVRTPAGSAIWLRIESFRRFIAASEAHHVAEAAKRGVLRQYTAWAVALGEVDHWSKMVAAADLPSSTTGLTTALSASAISRSITSAGTTPSSSGGGGGGGSGGGGGGGGGGSW